MPFKTWMKKSQNMPKTGLAEQNGFGPAFLHSLQRGW
jgi:hypothetical protein